jgi:hypothetical protein
VKRSGTAGSTPSPDSSRASGGIIRPARVNNVALAGLRRYGEIYRRLRCAPPPVIHDVAASAAKGARKISNSTVLPTFLHTVRNMSYLIFNIVHKQPYFQPDFFSKKIEQKNLTKNFAAMICLKF